MRAVAREQRWDVRANSHERRDEILKGLGMFLREQRLSSLKMQDIADQLGMTKGNLYYYFKNKQDILYNCHLKSMTLSLAALWEAERSRKRPSERLHALLVRHIRGITEEAYGAVLLTDLENLTAAQRRRYVAMRDEFENGVRRIIDAGISSGEFRKVDVRVTGFAILGAINWISKWYNPEGRLTASNIAESFADFLVQGLRG